MGNEMLASARRWRTGIAALAFLAAAMTGRAAAQSPAPAACAGPAYHQLDFWIGDWDVFEIDGKAAVARVRVERILDGCVLHEDYRGANGSKGESFTIFDEARGVWHQSWVTNRGRLLVIEGTFQEGALTLSGVQHDAGGKEKRVRGTWQAVAAGVREQAVTSTDDGATWQAWFDLVFRPHKP
jgi:hypothetical protein